MIPEFIHVEFPKFLVESWIVPRFWLFARLGLRCQFAVPVFVLPTGVLGASNNGVEHFNFPNRFAAVRKVLKSGDFFFGFVFDGFNEDIMGKIGPVTYRNV